MDSLRYVDSIETETHVYIATERVKSLDAVLSDWDSSTILSGPGKAKAKQEWLAWGIRSIGTALAFVNAPPLSQHHALVLSSSIYITPALEWRLGGFDLLTGKDDQSGALWGAEGLVGRKAGEVSCPEVRKSGWSALRE